MRQRWRSIDQQAATRTLDELGDSLSALGDKASEYWAEGFRGVARDLECAAAKENRKAVYLLVGRMLRGGMGSVNDVYSPDLDTDQVFRLALKRVHRMFGLSSTRMLFDDMLLGKASWYR